MQCRKVVAGAAPGRCQNLLKLLNLLNSYAVSRGTCRFVPKFAEIVGFGKVPPNTGRRVVAGAGPHRCQKLLKLLKWLNTYAV